MSFKLNISEFLDLQKRLHLNMTQTARYLSISRTQLWRVLSGQCDPGEQFIAGFKKAFPAEEFDLFFLIKPMQQSDTEKDDQATA